MMPADETHNSSRQQTVLCMALVGGVDVPALLEFCDEEEQNALISQYEAFVRDGNDVSERAQEALRKLLAMRRFCRLGDVHPGWVLEALKHESPRVIGMLLRYLPAHHVRYVIEHLPEHLRAQLPDMVESFQVSPAVLQIIRKRFEHRFLHYHLSNHTEHAWCAPLMYLPEEQGIALLRELGVQEMAMALSTMSAASLRILLNRLRLNDARRLQKRFSDLQGVSTALKHEARLTLLEVAEAEVGADQLLIDMGAASFGRALSADDVLLMKAMMQRMEPHAGFVLKRAFDMWAHGPELAHRVERRQMISDAFSRLVQEGTISQRPSEASQRALSDRVRELA